MSWEENCKGVVSERLRALLIFSKRPDVKDWTWQGVAEALAEIYSPGMRLYWVLHHLMEAYQEAAADPRFEMGRADVLEVLMAPIKGHTSIDLIGPASLQTQYTVEQFYNAMVLKLLGQIQCANIAWLREPAPQT